MHDRCAGGPHVVTYVDGVWRDRQGGARCPDGRLHGSQVEWCEVETDVSKLKEGE